MASPLHIHLLLLLLLLTFLTITTTTTASPNHPRSSRSTRRTMNVIDRCWRRTTNWSSNRQRLAMCSVGFAGKMSSNIGRGLTRSVLPHQINYMWETASSEREIRHMGLRALLTQSKYCTIAVKFILSEDRIRNLLFISLLKTRWEALALRADIKSRYRVQFSEWMNFMVIVQCLNCVKGHETHLFVWSDLSLWGGRSLTRTPCMNEY